MFTSRRERAGVWRADVVSSPRGRRRHVAAYTVVCTSILYSALRSAVDRFTAPFIGSQRLYTAPFRSVHGPVRRAARFALRFAGRAVRAEPRGRRRSRDAARSGAVRGCLRVRWRAVPFVCRRPRSAGTRFRPSFARRPAAQRGDGGPGLAGEPVAPAGPRAPGVGLWARVTESRVSRSRCDASHRARAHIQIHDSRNAPKLRRAQSPVGHARAHGPSIRTAPPTAARRGAPPAGTGDAGVYFVIAVYVCVGAIGRSIRCTGSLHPNSS